MNGSQYLTTREVAKRLGIPVRTLNRWADEGSVTPALKAPGKRGARMYDPAEVARIAAKRPRASAA